VHGAFLKEHQGEYASELRALMRGVEGVGRQVRDLSRRNGFEVEFLTQRSATQGNGKTIEAEAEKENAVLLDDVDHDMGEANGQEDWIGLE